MKRLMIKYVGLHGKRHQIREQKALEQLQTMGL